MFKFMFLSIFEFARHSMSGFESFHTLYVYFINMFYFIKYNFCKYLNSLTLNQFRHLKENLKNTLTPHGFINALTLLYLVVYL